MASTTGLAIPGDAPARARADRTTLYFFGALALATLLPLLLLPFYGVGRSEDDFPAIVLLVWVLAGYGHVMSTVWFGLDDEYRDTIRTHRARIYGSLAVVPLALGAMAVASPAASAWLYTGYLVWQAHHYNRQNYGILSFAAVRDGGLRLPPAIGTFILLTTAAGAIRAVTMPGIYPGEKAPLAIQLPAFVAVGFWTAVLCLAAAAVLLVHMLATHAGLRRSPTVLLFLLLTLGFFTPSLSAGPAPIAFWPFAMAHGLQYLIITGVLARRSRRGLRGLAIFMALALLLGFVAVAMTGGVPWTQIYTGLIVTHFLADARLWRLRDPAVRDIVKRRFDFLFSR